MWCKAIVVANVSLIEGQQEAAEWKHRLSPLIFPSVVAVLQYAIVQLTPSVFLRDSASGSKFCPRKENQYVLWCALPRKNIPNIHNSLINTWKGLIPKCHVLILTAAASNIQWFINRTRLYPQEFLELLSGCVRLPDSSNIFHHENKGCWKPSRIMWEEN